MTTKKNLTASGLIWARKSSRVLWEKRQKTGEKKRVDTRYGKIEILRKHGFAGALGTQRLSPFFRELIIFVGQKECYESAAELINKLLRATTNDTQVFRQTSNMGGVASGLQEKELPAKAVGPDDLVYAQADGSMVLTREEKWKETKVGRVFLQSAVYRENENRGWIKHSDYVAHLGGHKDFEAKMSRLIDPYAKLGNRLIFVTDGAPWMRNWISAEYPKATQILDFYHAAEHLGDFAALYFTDKGKRMKWVSENLVGLKKQGVRAVIKEIENLASKTKTVEGERTKLLNYYRANAYRMDYPGFVERGYLIGSGAIEAAHRTLIQKRMKLSGQRWSKDGAQAMLDLRSINMSNRWGEIVSVLRKAA